VENSECGCDVNRSGVTFLPYKSLTIIFSASIIDQHLSEHATFYYNIVHEQHLFRLGRARLQTFAHQEEWFSIGSPGDVTLAFVLNSDHVNTNNVIRNLTLEKQTV
jgi:hypothetical protein